MAKPTHTVDEAQARAITLVRACEAAGTPAALWSPEDAAWATRVAREELAAANKGSAGTGGPAGTGGTGGANTLSAAQAATRLLALRAQHALQRLLPRQSDLALHLKPNAAWGWAPPAAVALAFVLGLLTPSLDASQHINLLALPLWGVVLWNVAVYVLLLEVLVRGRKNKALAGPLRSALAGLRSANKAKESESLGARFNALWFNLGAPLALGRVAFTLHAAAAALGLGLIVGLYARGLVLDYRAGWQSTFLDAPSVHAVLNLLLTPAQWLTGLSIPSALQLADLRVQPGRLPSAPAALWLHLLAATVALAVVLPRLALAAAAWWQMRRLSRALALPMHEPYFAALAPAGLGQGPLQVQCLPHGGELSAASALGLRAALAQAFGADVQIHLSSPVPYGEEEKARLQGTAQLALVCVDLTATPEAEAHGRLLQALVKPSNSANALKANEQSDDSLSTGASAFARPVLIFADASAFVERFAGLPRRRQQREAAWQAFAREHHVAFVSFQAVNLERAKPEVLHEVGQVLLQARHGA